MSLHEAVNNLVHEVILESKSRPAAVSMLAVTIAQLIAADPNADIDEEAAKVATTVAKIARVFRDPPPRMK
jgi:hypothetical protein